MADKQASPALQPLTNSQRRLYKATYRPLTVPTTPQEEVTGRFLEKLAFLRGLNIQPQEIVWLGGDSAVHGQESTATDTQASDFRRIIEIMKGLTTDVSFAAIRRYGPLLARVPPDKLIRIGNALVEMRRAVAVEMRDKLRELQDKHAEAQAISGRAATETSAEAAVTWARDERLPAYDDLQSITLQWLSAPGIEVAGTGQGTLPAVISPALISDLPRVLEQRANQIAILISSFDYQVQIEPVGQLHLERIEMTPAGIEHGELVHSVPLTPKETVNIAQREWTVVTKTFESIVTDSLEGFSETGVSEKTDLSQATDNEAQHSASLDVNGSVSATYNGAVCSVTASAAVDYNQQTDTTQIEKDSIAHSLAITRNASTRSKKEHKMSFCVSSVAGAENMSVRVITNPSDTNAMRVDYFQLLRKWQVELIRYGLRMTYDIVIPNPGVDIIGPVLEIQAIDEMLTTASYSFGLLITDITRDNWADLSQQYGVELDRPPEEVEPLTLHKEFQIGKDDSQDFIFDAFDFEVPPDYEIVDASFSADIPSIHTSASNHELNVSGTGDIYNGTNSGFSHVDWLKGRTGKLSVVYYYVGLDRFSVQLYIVSTLKVSAFSEWRLKSWTALRNADAAAYDKRIEQANERKAFLQAQIAQFDALTLRKMEREEIMRWVLRWLLGPGFDLMPPYLTDLFQNYPPYLGYKPPALSADGTAYPFNFYKDVNQLGGSWQWIINYGEFIKYIHDAVEWENVLFFAYPYFWDTVKNWPFKRFLMHPDPIHREFLRSGAMRVVLTIRPGFEESFARLQRLGWTSAPGDHPYVTIADDIRNFAMTNYEGIPPANPDNNVRPLLYPEQRKAWNDMQKLIQLIEDYNDAGHKRTMSSAITSTGRQTVTPSSMEGIEYGTKLTIDPGGSYEEAVIVNATTPATFTADFAHPHAAGVALQIDPAIRMYPTTNLFPAVIPAFAGNTPLPLTDPWGRPYHYTSPGLNADYDLVCYGKDGIPDQDQTARQRADPLNKNITNYAEGSIVGRWYEYTPTGALDVAINTVLPTIPQPA